MSCCKVYGPYDCGHVRCEECKINGTEGCDADFKAYWMKKKADVLKPAESDKP